MTDPTIAGMHARLRSGETTPEREVAACYERIARWADPATFIALVPRERALAQARALAGADPDRLPLLGATFAIKDNIDLAGLPTTAGCPAFASTPRRSAHVVERLIAAGAIPVAKANLDQFATGLVGVRSPYGVPRHPIDPARIPGGSSSGSAVAVSAGLVSFALGTDTAGSGRVPAGFTGIVGLKPSRGLLSTRGVVPAVRTLDCVSIFALTAADAATVLRVARGPDPEDPFSRALADAPGAVADARLGMPGPADLAWHDDPAAGVAFALAVEGIRGAGHALEPIGFAPFTEAAALLYDGPWVAERAAAVGDFIAAHPGEVDPVVAGIVAGAASRSAVDAYRGAYRLAELRRAADAVWSRIDALVVPTAPRHPTIAEVRAAPLAVNAALGRYTNFANLLDLCAIALPGPLRADGLPAGITLLAPAGHDRRLAALGERLQRAFGAPLGATGSPQPSPAATLRAPRGLPLVVFGAHLRGQPLNGQLTDAGGRFVSEVRTAPRYRMHALPTTPPKPGVVRVDAGTSLPGELWELPPAGLGTVVAAVPPPLCIGTVELDDGRWLQGFLCEPHALAGAPDISAHGGWVAWMAQRAG